jgi:hypothetical protein
MTFLVKDFAPALQRWVSWVAQSIPTAYDEYPHGNTQGYPTLLQLSNKLVVVKEIIEGGGGVQPPPVGIVPRTSLWDLVGNDLIPTMIVDGATGLWAIRVLDNTTDNVVTPFVDIDGIVHVEDIVLPNATDVFDPDANGNAIANPSNDPIDKDMMAMTDADGNIFFASEQNAIDNDLYRDIITSDKLSIKNIIEIIPGSSTMPDKYWTRNGNDLVVRL